MTVCNHDLPKSVPYTPYHTIQNILPTNLWDKILDIAQDRILCGAPEITLRTSCIVNLIALSILFVGEERTRNLHYPLGFETIFRVKKATGVVANFEEHILYGVVSGVASMKQNKYVEDPEHRFQNDKAIKKASKLAVSFIRNLEVNYGKISNLRPFGYNGTVITALENEISLNAIKVTHNSSFIYHIAISCPIDVEKVMSGSPEEVEQVPSGYYHAFILEQYFSNDLGKSLVRFHQAWVDEFGLQEHYEIMGFDDADQGCFDRARLGQFFQNLRNVLLCAETPVVLMSKLREYQRLCFNINLRPLVPVTFRFESGIHFGLSLRYVTSKINPSDCLIHLRKFKETYSLK